MKMSKKIYDPVHGFIRLNEWEKQLIDSLPFQRLHYIHQLGIAYLVYPGATHTRFEHSLGTMELVTRIFDQIVSKGTDIPDEAYWRQIIRFAALCHDLGHLPFSHVAEKQLMGEEGHEKMSVRFIKSAYLLPIWQEFQATYPDKPVVDDLVKITVGEKKVQALGTACASTPFTPWERVVSEMLIGDFFGADRIDYLLRDAKCTGVSYGLFDYHQLIEMLCVLPGVDGEGLRLGIEENGIESCEALLLARHFMYRRVYLYPSVKAYAFHMSNFMSQMIEAHRLEEIESYLMLTESEVLSGVSAAAKNPHAKGYKDAVCLTQRALRFSATELPDQITEDMLQRWMESCAIPYESAFWEFSRKKRHQLGLSFPVLRKDQSIVDASVCSMLRIPAGGGSYIYLDPTYKNRLYPHLASAVSSGAFS